jgi:hypothetical protein
MNLESLLNNIEYDYNETYAPAGINADADDLYSFLADDVDRKGFVTERSNEMELFTNSGKDVRNVRDYDDDYDIDLTSEQENKPNEEHQKQSTTNTKQNGKKKNSMFKNFLVAVIVGIALFFLYKFLTKSLKHKKIGSVKSYDSESVMLELMSPDVGNDFRAVFTR